MAFDLSIPDPEATKKEVEAQLEVEPVQAEAINDKANESGEQIMTVDMDSFADKREIVNAIGEVFNGAVATIGDAISQIVDAVGGLAESIGGAISGVLDSVAGIFDSIGNAAINAGTGMQAMVDAIDRLMGMDVFAMGASLVAASDGIGQMVSSAQGATEAASSMEYLNGLVQSVMNRFSEIGTASASLQASASGAARAYSNVVLAISAVATNSGVAVAGFAAVSAATMESAGTVQASSGAMVAAIMMLPSATATGVGAFKNFASGVSSAMGSARAAVSSACSSMRSTVAGLNLTLPRMHGSVPVFATSGSYNAKTGSTPTVYVSGYRYFASGGFTSGPVAIAGEAGTEAVISFDPRYRDDNIAYWLMAGQMLGLLQPFAAGGFTDGTASELSIEIASPTGLLATAAGNTGSYGSSSSSINFGGVTFAPQITVSGTGEQDVLEQLKTAEDDFFDLLDEWAAEREDDYAPVF